MQSSFSNKAWMSATDANLIEQIIRASATKQTDSLNVLEWGAGQSTVYYSGILDSLGVNYVWTSLEYDIDFLQDRLYSDLLTNSQASIGWICPEWDMPEITRPASGHGVIHLVCYPRGRLLPFSDAHKGDRAVNLDDYVGYPASYSSRYDLVFVDGRKRRRCLIKAAELLKPSGVVILHDAHRPYYHCAFSKYTSQMRLGDDLWIGARHITSFREYLEEDNSAPASK